MLKVCIFGGGAIGGYIAAHLARAKQCEVSVVARGETFEAIRNNGIRIVKPSEEFTVPVNVCATPDQLRAQDYIFVTLKAHQMDGAINQIVPLMDSHTTVLPPTTGIPYYFFHDWQGGLKDRQMDGIDPNGRQWRALPPEQALGCVYWIGAHSIEPGVIVQDGEKSGCPIGELNGSYSERVGHLAELLNASGIASKVNSDIRAAIWVKFVNSLCWNPVAVLTQATLGEMREAGDVVPVVKAMMKEADTVASRLGLEIGPDPEKRIAVTLNAPHHKMSMLQDFEAGRPLELETLAQSLHAVRELADVETPVLDSMLALARLRAQTGRRPSAVAPH
jgi:2-dehydropantoate 2-reductase